jgi:CspA family cold shock protein
VRLPSAGVSVVSVVTGTVKWFSPKKGFGFIIVDGSGQEVFAHYSKIQNNGDFRELEKGEKVRFKLATGVRGLFAEDIRRGERE